MKKFLIVLIILASLILQSSSPVNVKTENFSSFFTKFKSELVHKAGDDFNVIYYYTPQFILKVYGHLEFMQNFAGREILHGHRALCFFKKYHSYVNQLLPITNPSVKFKGERNEFELSINMMIYYKDLYNITDIPEFDNAYGLVFKNINTKDFIMVIFAPVDGRWRIVDFYSLIYSKTNSLELNL